MHLRSRLRQLKLRLGQSDALGHREDVRIADGDDVYAVVKVRRKDSAGCARDFVGVFLRQVIPENPSQNAELGLLRVVQALVDSRHDLHAALQKRHGCADRSLLVHVADLFVGQRDKPTTALDQASQELTQRSAGLLVRQRHQGVAQIATGGVHVAPLSGLDGLVAVTDANALGLKAAGQVGQRSGVDELAEDRRCRPTQTANHVHQAKAVEA